MAIDFPPNSANPNAPQDGDTYVDSSSGTEWTYDATNNSWTLSGSGTPGGSAFSYIGEHNFTQATVPDPAAEAGYVYSQSDLSGATGTVNGVYNGIAGDSIVEGDLVLYTGSSWTLITNVPGYPNLGDGNGDTLDDRYVQTQPDGNAPQNVDGDLTITGGITVTENSPTEYSVYAGGNSANYFKGDVFIAPVETLTLSDPGKTHFLDVRDGLKSGSLLDFKGSLMSSRDPGSVAANLFLENHSTTEPTFTEFRVNSTNIGSISTDGSTLFFNGQLSDYRLKKNITPIQSTVDKVKALNVINFEYTERAPGVTHEGFVAHELAEVCPKAVSGTKDKTEAIGTYTDVDGNIETDVPEPAAIPAGAYWEQTGTRDVYQGVDQAKLIPMLTKALQEALERIEALENA